MVLELMIKCAVKMLVSWLTLRGGGDLFPQSLGVDTLPPSDPKPPRAEFNYSVGFKDLNGKHNNFFP